MLVDTISRHYIASFMSVLFTVLIVICGFESLLHLLKLLKNHSFFSQQTFFALLNILLDFPDKVADILPLTLYISVGIHHYLWSSKNYSLIISLVGFEPKRFQSLSMILVIIFFLFSVALKGFIAPTALSYYQMLKPRAENHLLLDTIDNYQYHENFYKFNEKNEVYHYNFTNKTYHQSQWDLENQTLVVENQPLLNLEVLKAKKYNFENLTLTKKVDLSLQAPESQKAVVNKALSEVLIHPLCTLLALVLGFAVFPLSHLSRHKKLSTHLFLSIICACFVFLTQHVFAHFIILPWESLCLAFFFCHFILVMSLMQLSKYTLR